MAAGLPLPRRPHIEHQWLHRIRSMNIFYLRHFFYYPFFWGFFRLPRIFIWLIWLNGLVVGCDYHRQLPFLNFSSHRMPSITKLRANCGREGLVLVHCDLSWREESWFDRQIIIDFCLKVIVQDVTFVDPFSGAWVHLYGIEFSGQDGLVSIGKLYHKTWLFTICGLNRMLDWFMLKWDMLAWNIFEVSISLWPSFESSISRHFHSWFIFMRTFYTKVRKPSRRALVDLKLLSSLDCVPGGPTDAQISLLSQPRRLYIPIGSIWCLAWNHRGHSGI